jgi:hypothetical protein
MPKKRLPLNRISSGLLQILFLLPGRVSPLAIWQENHSNSIQKRVVRFTSKLSSGSPLLTSCVTSGKLLSFAVSQFTHI